MTTVVSFCWFCQNDTTDYFYVEFTMKQINDRQID